MFLRIHARVSPLEGPVRRTCKSSGAFFRRPVLRTVPASTTTVHLIRSEKTEKGVSTRRPSQTHPQIFYHRQNTHEPTKYKTNGPTNHATPF